MTSRSHSDTSLHQVDGDTMVSGRHVHAVDDDILTVEGGDTVDGRRMDGETSTKKGRSDFPGRHVASMGHGQHYDSSYRFNGETITVIGLSDLQERHAASSANRINGEANTTKKGRSNLQDHHAATKGQPQYYDSTNPRANESLVRPPSKPSTTRGSTTQQPNWDGQEATSNVDFWNHAFHEHNTTMLSEEDEERATQGSMARDFNQGAPTRAPTPVTLATKSTEPMPRQTMINVGSTTPLSQHSRALSFDTVGSIWKQRLCGVRADHLVLSTLLFLLLAVAAIAGAIVATPTSSTALKSLGGVDPNDLGRNETISLTRTPTSVALQNASPQPTVLAAPSVVFPTPPTPETSILDAPSAVPLTSCVGVVDDFTVVFPVGDRDRNCTWFLNRPAERKRHCVEGQLGYEFCRAACGNCAPFPPGEASWPWPEQCGSDADDTVKFEVEDNTNGDCGFLATAGSLKELCQPGLPAFDLCRETCRNCGSEAVSPEGGSSLEEELQALVLKASPTSQGQLENVLTEQYRALEWIQVRVVDGSFGADVSADSIVQKWALACFAYSIDWDEQWLQSGNDECAWDGITCNDAGIVTAIILDNRSIRGKFVPELSLLLQLERLIVSENSMSGNLPRSFGKLSNLQDFRMDRNNFGGELPSSIGGMTSLRIWYLERNVNLGGAFPDSVLLLDNLEELVFYSTIISGELPAGVCSFVGLESLIFDCRQVQSDCWTDCFF